MRHVSLPPPFPFIYLLFSLFRTSLTSLSLVLSNPPPEHFPLFFRQILQPTKKIFDPLLTTLSLYRPIKAEFTKRLRGEGAGRTKQNKTKEK
jgi:hypothetical protein